MPQWGCRVWSDADVVAAERDDTLRHDDVKRAVEGNSDVRYDGQDNGNKHAHVHDGSAQHGVQSQRRRQHGLARTLPATNTVWICLCPGLSRMDGDLMFSTCSSVQNEWTHFAAQWHTWSARQGDVIETINFGRGRHNHWRTEARVSPECGALSLGLCRID